MNYVGWLRGLTEPDPVKVIREFQATGKHVEDAHVTRATPTLITVSTGEKFRRDNGDRTPRTRDPWVSIQPPEYS